MKTSHLSATFKFGVSTLGHLAGRKLVLLTMLLLAAGFWQGCGTVKRQVTVISVPAGATVRIDGSARGTTPFTSFEPLKWSEDKMPQHVVEVDKLPEYGSQRAELSYLEAKKITDPWIVSVELPLIRRDIPVTITCNVDGASVLIDGREIGVAPIQNVFTFTRSSPSQPWNTFLVVVKKEGYRARPAPGVPDTSEVQPVTRTVTFDDASKGELKAELVPVIFVRSPVAELIPTSRGMQMVQKNLLSQVGEIEREPKVGGATRMTDFPPERATHETRLSLLPDGSWFAFSYPFTGQNLMKTNLYFNLWLRRGNEQTRLTDAPQVDIEACVSPDGQWVYFSSDRLQPGKQNIWRMPTAGRGGLTKITDSPSSKVDTDPAISPDGKRMAFTSFLEGVEVPQIWVANADGTLPTQIRAGKLPCWSPDGERIAFVAADTAGNDKVWVMSADGGNPTQLTSGDHTDLYPIWTPDGKRIVYASDRAINEAGERNFDIWVMNADGTQNTQLTVNGSHDTRPAVSKDGRHIYFNSNRGARRVGESAVQIWRIELPPQ
jgi:Tol biopolymer transport system component